MNSKSLIAAAAFAIAGASTFAIEGEQIEAPYGSSLTREAVQAEMQEHLAAGAWEPMNEASPDPVQTAEWDRRIAELQGADALAQAAQEHELLAMADRYHGPVFIIIEAEPAVPADEVFINE